jgi:phosphate-selective porin OprO/OprP
MNNARRAPLLALLPLLTAPALPAQDGDDLIALGRKGLSLDLLEGDLELSLGGRLHVDVASWDSDVNGSGDEALARRARLSFEARYLEDWRLKVEGDVAGASVGWKNLWGRYQGLDPWRFTLGNQIAPFGLDQAGSSNTITFLERALPSALEPAFQNGLRVDTHGDHWTASLGAFTHPVEGDDDRESRAASGVLRLTYAPLDVEGDEQGPPRVVHLGTSVELRELESDSSLRFDSRPETRLTDFRMVSTGNLADADSSVAVSLEAAALRGPFSLQAEAVGVRVDRATSPDPDFVGWYAQASWILTGESRRYSGSRGTFGDVRPDSRGGAWELAARFSSLDLEDAGVTGGEQTDVTLGLNWYVNRNVRVMFNWIHAEANPNRNGVDDSTDVLAGRFQVFF